MKCILTDTEVSYETLDNTTYYKLNFAQNEVEIFICRGCDKKIKTSVPPHIIKGLIANKQFPKRSFLISKSCTHSIPPADSETIILENFFATAIYPKTPKEKLENLFYNLFKRQKFDGESFSVNLNDNEFWIKNYFQNVTESKFYFDGLISNNLINLISGSINVFNVSVTHLGLNKAIELMEEGDKSKNCFIAMSFDHSTKDTREAIRQALKHTNYEAIIIDEQIIDSQRTINDEIIASLKRCKFCIADFSLHSNGVYFESGFALGQGKKVIYTCSKKEFDKAHFDIKPLQHIVYETTEELTKKLIFKIEAYID